MPRHKSGGAKVVPTPKIPTGYILPFAEPPPPQTASQGAVPPASAQDDATGDQEGSTTTSSPIHTITPKIGIGSLGGKGKTGWGLSLQGLGQQHHSLNYKQSCTSNNGNRGGGNKTLTINQTTKKKYGVCVGVAYTKEDAKRDMQYTIAAELDIMEDELGDFGVPAASLILHIEF